jgi:predicted transcriptional regulator
MVRDALRYLLDIGVVQYQPSKDVNNLQFTLTPKGEAYLHETHHSATGV